MQEVKLRTDGQVHLAPGTLYGAIKRLLGQTLIEESEEQPDPQLKDERRRYYRLIGLGQRVLSAEAARMAWLVQLAQTRRLLRGQSDIPATGGS